MSRSPEAPTRERPLVLLMDGHSLVFRSWYAIQQSLTVRSTGEEVKGIYGFTNTFLRALRDWKPTHCAIAFDLDKPSFRHLQYKEYKAQREAAPPALHQQIVYAHRLMEAFHVPIFEAEGYEADDVLGTLACQAEAAGVDVVILTGDTDTLQLVTPSVRVDLHYRIQESKVFDVDAVRGRFGGLEPGSQPQLKALSGDASDNIPGVPGIGEKTAVKLISEHKSLEGIYEDIEFVPRRVKEKLQEHRDQVFLSRTLGTIVLDAPVSLDLEACRFGQYDRQEVIQFLRGFEFYSIVNRVPEPGDTENDPSAPPGGPSLVRQPVTGAGDYGIVTDLAGLDVVVDEAQRAEALALGASLDGKSPVAGTLVGLALSAAPGRAWYIPVGHRHTGQLAVSVVLDRLNGILGSPEIPKIAHDAPFLLTVLQRYGVRLEGLASDTMVAAHLANRKALALDAVALDILGEELPDAATLLGSGSKRRLPGDVDPAQFGPYAAASTEAVMRVRGPLENQVREGGGWRVYTEALLPLAPVLARMQVNGVAVDVALLEAMSGELRGQLDRLEADIHGDVGHEFNISSPQQLSYVLFTELGLPRTKRTRTGAYTTDAAALEGLAGLHPVIGKLLEHRQLSKIKSTYVDALPGLVDRDTGRLHTTYHLTGSATGRLSSSDPNLQNIPVRTELGRRVRRAFVAAERPDWVLLAADYSQIELRVLAHLTQDEALLTAFNSGEDIHASTASRMFEVPRDRVTQEMRRIAKILNFGVIYGLSPFGVSQQTGFSVEQGSAFIDSYFSRYPGVGRYVEDTKNQARTNGYVETLLGRRRYLPEINSRNPNIRQAAERMAINMPVQGTAAEVIQLAMVNIFRWMEGKRVRSRMLLQVHDELIFEVPRDELQMMRSMVGELMPSAMELSVPLEVEFKQGESWGDLE